MKCKLKAAALVLAVLMIVSCAAGCGTAAQSSAAAETASAVSRTEASAQDAPEVEPEAAAAPEAEASDMAPAEEATPEEPESEPIPEPEFTFPLEEPVTLTAWAMWIPGILEFIDSAADNLAYAQAAENTGVTIDFDLCASDSVAATAFNLIIASGDYPDLF